MRAGIKRNRRRSEKAWRRTYRPALPSIIMGKICSLNNKFEELEALVKRQKVYREASLLCFSETWLQDSVPDYITSISGFRTIRAATGKRKGGGLAVFINSKWCNPHHATIKKQICNKDIELLAVSLRPYYMPREFPAVIAIVVYIPPSAHAETACDVVHPTIARLQAKYPDSFMFLSGDFNHVSLTKTLPTFKQYVDCTNFIFVIIT